MLNNKKITEVWLPGEGNSHNTAHRLGINGVTDITYISQSCGGGMMDWIVVEQGHLTRKIRPEQVTEVVWANEKS
jgi:hypothetical protein